MRSLKRQLHKLHGFPPRFRQRILHLDNCLDDDVELDSPMDVELVLLMYASPSETQVSDMLSAAEVGHVLHMEQLLQLPLQPTPCNEFGESLLLLACDNGQVQVARLLLEAYADVNAADKDGETPLLMASCNGCPVIVRVLLEARADPNLANDEGSTPLQEASANGNVEDARILIEAGAEKDFRHQNFLSTAIWVATQNGHPEVVSLLLELGADMNLADLDGATPLHVASSQNNVGISNLLVQAGADIDLPDCQGFTALHFASKHGHAEIVSLLNSKRRKVDSAKDWESLKWSSWRDRHKHTIWEFPKIRGTLLGVPIIRIIVYWGLYWGPLILGNYHILEPILTSMHFSRKPSSANSPRAIRSLRSL